MQVLTTTVARYFFTVPIIIFGLMHLMSGSQMAGMVPIPGGVFWVYLTGLAHIAAGVSIIIKKYDRLAGLLLGLMIFIFALSIQLPMAMSADPGTMQMGVTNFLKDLIISGCALTYAGLASSK